MKVVSRVVGMALLVAILGGASVAAVAAQEPSDAWVALAPGETQTYSFEYLGDGSPVEVRMQTAGQSGASFSVWTPEQALQAVQGAEVEPVGRGSVNEAVGGALVWLGSFNAAGSYQVVVENAGPGPAYYMLEITGDGVWYPQADGDQTAEQSPQEPVGQSAAAATGAPAKREGTGLGDALAIPDEWQAIAFGGSRWYAVEYAGDGSQIDLVMQTASGGSATVSIYTPEQIRQWVQGAPLEAVGRGSAESLAGGALVWSGSFNAPGVYYVVVEHAGNQSGPAYYLLQVTGDGLME